MIKRFKEVSGLYIEKIYGQDRLAFAMSDTSDLYDLVEYAQRGGYQGSVIKFYDFENGNVYTPFEKKRDVIYSKPVYTDGFYFFLQADYELGKVTLYKYLPEEALETVEFLTDDRVYIEKWIEEGWDEENNCATDEYKYYDKVLVKDHAGNTLSEEVGSIYQAADGTYWLA